MSAETGMPLDARWPARESLHVENVCVFRGEHRVLRDVSVQFDPGRRYVLVGPSGAGKSTLLRLLNRLEDPERGLVRIGETPYSDIPTRRIRNAVGYVFQNPVVLPGTLRDNLIYPWEIRSLRPPSPETLRLQLLEVGLNTHPLDREAASLSGGERQRLALLTALQMNPEFLLLDEPTSGLDPISAERVAEFLERRALEFGLRTIVVTHHREHALRLGDWGIAMSRGEILASGPIRRLLQTVDSDSWSQEATTITGSSS